MDFLFPKKLDLKNMSFSFRTEKLPQIFGLFLASLQVLDFSDAPVVLSRHIWEQITAVQG